DRERVAERLRTGHAEGRLDMAEFQERLEHCYAAKTFGELRALVRDLPREEASHGRGLLGQSPRRWRLAPLVPVLLVLFVVSAATGEHHGHHQFWLWVPIVFLIWRLTWWRRKAWSSATRRAPGDWR